MAMWLWMESYLTHGTYLAVAAILMAGGLGMPIPEDIPLLVAGYLCYQQLADIFIMLPLCLFCIMFSDLLLFYMGRRYGEHVPRLPLIRRFLTPKTLDKAHQIFKSHGGKTLFVARFLPGLRAPLFFTAGALHVPWWKMIFYDGLAALISVPTLVLLAYFFGAHIDYVRDLVKHSLWVIALVAVLVVISVMVYRQWFSRVEAVGAQ